MCSRHYLQEKQRVTIPLQDQREFTYIFLAFQEGHIWYITQKKLSFYDMMIMLHTHFLLSLNLCTEPSVE